MVPEPAETSVSAGPKKPSGSIEPFSKVMKRSKIGGRSSKAG